ncbi:MFS transporter [Kitasatospora sp. GAS204B]|uniref:MFS transporter n=1 Tax=unclassified Kitasatospora TaxID=2633591 RepID=UPI002474F7DE|nr:MFS transporter [Kitasatospora sp. GAS204B]MDH6117256.1 MFS family permease [Kitasatospora sp. GAS204B]
MSRIATPPTGVRPKRSRPEDGAARAVYRKAAVRLLPLLGLLYLVSYLDRSNIAFAGPNGMNHDLGLSSAAFGLASGIFFLGYSLLEVPSNLALRRFGARKWLVRILVSWGVVATATAYVQGAGQLEVARLLLGMAEAGCLPGIVLYLTMWFPREVRTRLTAWFFLSLPLSTALGAPLSALLIQWSNGLFGLAGWRSMFLFEGLPALALAVVVWYLLPDGPEQARWLTGAERQLLRSRLDQDATPTSPPASRRWSGSLPAPRVWGLAFAYFGIIYGQYALGFFLPTIIGGFETQAGHHFSIIQRGLINAVPYLVAAAVLVGWARRAQRAESRAPYVIWPSLVAGAVIPFALYLHGPLLTMAAITVCAVAVLSAIPVFWALPTEMLSRDAAVVGIAVVNTVGSLSGFAAPYVTGWLKDLTGSTEPGLWLAGAMMLLSAGLVAILSRRQVAVETVSLPAPTPRPRTVASS